jgi:hypothetical protein
MTDADPRPEPTVSVPGAPHVTGAPTSPGPTGVDPLTAPLTYPGTPPRRPAVVVTGDAVLVLGPLADAPLGKWPLQADSEASSTGPDPDGPDHGEPRHPDLNHPEPRPPDPGRSDLSHPDLAQPRRGRDASAAVSGRGPDQGEAPLDRYLLAAGGSSAAALTPVLAVGSNASPAQLRRKLNSAGLPTLVPITAVRVRGLAVGVSAHVSRPGYLPATPIPSAGAVSDLWVLWLDEAALAAVDATEPNYERVLLPDRCPVRLTTGQPVPECWVYLSRHGYLLNEAGEPRRLTDQPTLISALLAEIPALPPLAGTTPREWIERTRDVAVRDAIREVFGSVGLVRRVKEL